MAVVAVYSIKGGVGKTTIAVDLAWRFAAKGRLKTLLWDLDPQGGAGFLLGKDELPFKRAASVFQREGRPGQLVVPTAYENLSLLQADESLRGLPLQLARLGQRRRMATLTTQFRSEFDRVVLDCPAGLSEVSDQVLAAADVLIVPLPPSPLSARALEGIRRELKANHLRHPPILPVLSMYNRNRSFHREVAHVEARGWPVVPLAANLEQSAIRRAPLGSFADDSDAGRALDRLWHAIEAKLEDIRPLAQCS